MLTANLIIPGDCKVIYLKCKGGEIFAGVYQAFISPYCLGKYAKHMLSGKTLPHQVKSCAYPFANAMVLCSIWSCFY